MATPEARRSRIVEKASFHEEPNTYPAGLPEAMRAVDWTIERARGSGRTPNIVHAHARVAIAVTSAVLKYQTCCRERHQEFKRAPDGAPVSCVYCLLCRGCIACRDGMITEETMRLGYWVTKNHRSMFPYELDDLHLVNAIRALRREGDRYKKNWQDWLVVLEAEAKLRQLPW